MTPNYTASSGEKKDYPCAAFTLKEKHCKKYIQVYLERVKRNKLLDLFFHFHWQLQVALC